MAVSEEFKLFIVDQCQRLGAITIRNMFGGARVYCDGIMFGLIMDDVFYLKVDETSCGAFEEEGQDALVYTGQRTPIKMSYWRCPERLLDDPDGMVEWASTALEVARSKKTR